MAHTTQHNVHSALPRKMHLCPSRLKVHATCTTPTRHRRRPNGFSQSCGACIANAVAPNVQFGDALIHLVILHKNSAAITAPMQYQVPLDLLSNGRGTHRSKRTEDSRVKGCPALSCLVSSSPVVSQHVLLLSQQAVPSIQSAVLEPNVNFRCPVPQRLCHRLSATYELEWEVESVVGHGDTKGDAFGPDKVIS